MEGYYPSLRGCCVLEDFTLDAITLKKLHLMHLESEQLLSDCNMCVYFELVCKWCHHAQHMDSRGGGETHKYWPLFWSWGMVWHLPESVKTSNVLTVFSPLADLFPSVFFSIHLSFFYFSLFLFFLFLFSFFSFSCLSALPCLTTFLIQRHPTSIVYICEQHLHLHK